MRRGVLFKTMTRFRVTVTLALMAAVGTSVTVLADEGKPAALSWVRGNEAQDCVSTRELAAQVEEQLGRVVFVAPAQAGIAVEGSIERTLEPAGYRVRLGLIEQGDSVGAVRVLELPPIACRELDPLLVFVLAAMLDPDAPLLPPRLMDGLSDTTRALLMDLFGAEPTVPPMELAAPTAKPAATVSTSSPAEPWPPKQVERTKPADPPRTALLLFSSGGATAGLVPGITPLASVELRGPFGAGWTLRGVASFWFPGSSKPAAGVQASVSAWTVSALACSEPFWQGALPLRPCAGLLLGALTTSVTGVAGAADPASLYAAPALALDMAWALGANAWLRLGATGHLSLLRDRFMVQRAGRMVEAHRVGWGSAHLDLGVGYAFR